MTNIALDTLLQPRSPLALGENIADKASPDWVDISDNHEILWNFLQGHNGMDLFDAALIFLPSIKTVSAWPTIEDMQNELAALDFLQGQNLTPFAMDVFGFLYLINDEGVYHMETEDGQLELIAESFNGFLLKLIEDGDYLSGQSFLQAFEAQNGSLQPGQRLAAKKPFIFGGEFEPSNLYAQDLEKIISWYGSLHEQLKDVEDGTVIQLQMPKDFN